MNTAMEKQIEQSIEQSTARYRQQRQMAKERRKAIKQGIKVIMKNDIHVYRADLDNGFRLAIAFSSQEANSPLVYSWAACSPKDKWSNRTAKGIIGNRLKDATARICSTCIGGTDSAAAYSVVSDIISEAANLPVQKNKRILVDDPAMSVKLVKKVQKSISKGKGDIIRSIQRIR